MLRKEILLLGLLAFVQFCNILDFMVMMPMGPVLMRTFAIGPDAFALLLSSYVFAAGLSGFLSAFVVDRYDRRRTLLTAFLGFTLGTYACALAPSYELLLAARTLTGIFGGVLGSTVLAIVGDAIPEQRRATAMGLVMLSFSLASIAGVPLGVYLAVELGWHAPFFLLGGLGSVLWLLLFAQLPSFRAHLQAGRRTARPLQVLRQVFEDVNQRRALLLMSCLMLSQFTVVMFLSPYFVSNVGFTEKQLSLIYLAGGLSSVVVSPLFGRLADRFGKQRVFVWLAVLSFGPSLAVTHLGTQPLAVALAVTTAFFIFNGGRMVPSTALITSTVTPATRGSFMSINSSVQQLSSGMATLLGGALVHRDAAGLLQGYGYAGYISVAATLLGIWVALRIRTRSQVPEPEAAA